MIQIFSGKNVYPRVQRGLFTSNDISDFLGWNQSKVSQSSKKVKSDRRRYYNKRSG